MFHIQAPAFVSIPFVQLSLLGSAVGRSYFLSSFQKLLLDEPVKETEEKHLKRR